MGLEAARLESSESMIFKGMEMVKKQLEDFLEARGVKEVKTEHEPFDPTHHEAVGAGRNRSGGRRTHRSYFAERLYSQ